jgi:hypothetical protein
MRVNTFIYKSNNIKCIVFFVFDIFVRFIKVSNFRLFKILFFYPSFSFSRSAVFVASKKLAHAPFEGTNYNRVIANREERKRINFLIHLGDGPEVNIRKLSPITLLICLFISYILIVFLCLYFLLISVRFNVFSQIKLTSYIYNVESKNYCWGGGLWGK